MSKFKVGDRVRALRKEKYHPSDKDMYLRKSQEGHPLYVGSISGDKLTINDAPQRSGGNYFAEDELEFFDKKRGREKKMEEKKYIIVKESCNNVETSTLKTKAQILNDCDTSNDRVVIDTADGKRYNVVVKKSLVLIRKQVVKKRKYKKRKKVK